MLKSLQVLLIKPSCDAIVQGSIFYRRLFRNREELEKLSELGVLFLLFEMGLELSLDRLKVQTPEQKQVTGRSNKHAPGDPLAHLLWPF